MQFSKLTNTSYSSALTDEEYEFICQQLKNIDQDVEYEGCVTHEILHQLIARFVGREFFKSEFKKDLEGSGFVTVDVQVKDKKATISLGLVHVGQTETKLVTGVLHK